MKKNKTKFSVLFLFSILFIGTMVNCNITPSSAATNPTRADVCWTTGYWNEARLNADNYLPWAVYPSFGSSFFYEALFGWNSLEGSYIPGLGESINWNPDGTVITIKIWDEAKWSGPGVSAGLIVEPGINDDVTANDVIYTYNLCNNSKWGDFGERIESIVQGADNKEVVITLHSNYAHSKQVKEWLTSDIPIVNSEVWSDICLTYGASLIEQPPPETFRNQWFDATFPTEWKVISGPYMQTGDPEDVDWDFDLYMKNPNWWGIGILHRDLMGPYAEGTGSKGDEEYPAFIGMKFYPDIEAAKSAMIAGEIDQGAYGLTNFKEEEMVSNTNLHSWYHDDDVRTYSAQGSNIELVFNTERFPMSETWFRKAIAKAIYYKPISTEVGGNHWIQGSPTYLNPKYNPEHQAIFNQTIHDTNAFDTNVNEAKQIFKDAGAYQKSEFGQMKWFIDAPLNAQVPLATQYNINDVVDSDPDELGIQIEIGPYNINTLMGWAETTTAVTHWANSISNGLELNVSLNEISWSYWNNNLTDSTFDLSMWTNGPRTLESPFQMFNSLVLDQSSLGNVSSWRGSNAENFVNALELYEMTNDPMVEQDQANIMQQAYAEDLPTIPSHINYMRYQYSDQYWKGWNNDGWQYNQPTTNYITDKIVINQRLILALAPTSSSWNPPASFTIQTTWPVGEEPWDGTPQDISPTALISADPTTIDIGQSVQFSYTGTMGNLPSDIQWNFGDSPINSTLTNPIHEYTSDGTYTATCTVTDGDGEQSSISQIITVGYDYVLGDVNHDEKVDIVDALLVAQFYVGDPVIIFEDRADVNKDGAINIVDALLIAQFYVGQIPAFP